MIPGFGQGPLSYFFHRVNEMKLKEFIKTEAKLDAEVFGEMFGLNGEEEETEFLKRIAKGYFQNWIDYAGVPENAGKVLRKTLPKYAGKIIKYTFLDLYCVYFSEENRKRWELEA